MSHVLEVGVSRPINDKRQLEETSQVQQDGIPLPNDSEDKNMGWWERQHFPEPALPGTGPPGPANIQLG